MRRDGRENRERLIEVAREVMREYDGDIALETIAERAGISRGTVYRNFDDRLQLYGAVLAQDLEIIGEEVRGSEDPAEVMEVMRRLVELMAVYDRFRAALPHLKDFRDDSCQADTMLDLVAEPTRRARDAGLLRADVTAQDILLACRMIASGWQLDLELDRDTALGKRLSLVMRGLGTGVCPTTVQPAKSARAIETAG